MRVPQLSSGKHMLVTPDEELTSEAITTYIWLNLLLTNFTDEQSDIQR